MSHDELCERIESLLDLNGITHLEYDDHGVSCRGDHDDLGRTMHMLYVNNLNDNTRVMVVDEESIGEGSGLFWDIVVNV